MNRQLEVASSYHRTSMTIHTVCIWQPWFQRVYKWWTNTAWQGACHIPVQGCGIRSHTNGYCTSPDMPLFSFVVTLSISPQREPPEPQRSPKESIPGWIWHGTQATHSVASRTPGVPQHCVALGGRQPNSYIGWSKTKLSRYILYQINTHQLRSATVQSYGIHFLRNYDNFHLKYYSRES